jgi:hypothetical protein
LGLIIDCVLFFFLALFVIILYNPKHLWLSGIGALVVIIAYGWMMYELFFYTYELESYIKIHMIPAALAGFLGRKFFKHKFSK